MSDTETKPGEDPNGQVDSTTLVPPVFAFQTLLNQLDSMKERAIPARIDRSFLVGMSGAGQAQYITGLRSLGLIDSAGVVKPRLTALVQASISERKRLLREILKERYARAVELGSTNATTGQLVELFRDEYGATGDTARKGIAFYLNAARYAGEVPLSPMFQTPKVTSSGTRKRRSSSVQPAQSGQSDREAPGDVPASGFGSPGTVIPNLHPVLAGVLSELPTRGKGWTKARRDQVLEMFKMAADFTIPIIEEEPVQAEEAEEPDDEIEFEEEPTL